MSDEEEPTFETELVTVFFMAFFSASLKASP